MNNYQIIAETFENKKICFYQCDFKKRFKLSEVLKLSAEIAGDDFSLRGFSHKNLLDKGMVFVVSKVSFAILEYPVDQQNIIASTWMEGNKGASFLRGFEIKDAETGESLIQGKSNWIVINPHTRKIIKPSSAGFDNMPQITDRESEAVPTGRIKAEKMTYVGKREIRMSDLDANGHVYNSVYADISIDYVSRDVYECNLNNFRINYISEAKLGDIVNIYTSYEGSRTVIIGMLDEKICFETELINK